MPDTPIQISVLEAIQDRLESITKGDEYHFTLKDRVFVGRPVFDENDPIPMISILEVPLPPEQRMVPKGSNLVSGKWELFIQGWVKEEDRNSKFLTKQAYCLKQDVQRALLRERKNFDRVGVADPLFGCREIQDFHLDRGVVRPDEERSTTAFFWMPLTIDLATG